MVDSDDDTEVTNSRNTKKNLSPYELKELMRNASQKNIDKLQRRTDVQYGQGTYTKSDIIVSLLSILGFVAFIILVGLSIHDPQEYPVHIYFGAAILLMIGGGIVLSGITRHVCSPYFLKKIGH
jgi:hypothetical protein